MHLWMLGELRYKVISLEVAFEIYPTSEVFLDRNIV